MTTLNYVAVPNPATSTITFNSPGSQKIDELHVFDINGHKVAVYYNESCQADVRTLPAGVYFAQIRSQNEVTVTTFVKQ